MTEENFNKIQDIFRQVFEDNNLTLTPELDANQVTMWDSLTHVSLINEVEQAFNITIPFVELMEFQNAGDLLNCVDRITSKS